MASSGARAVPVGCRGGGCGICRIRVLSGEVERGAMSRSHVTIEEERQGFALACRLFPRSDLVIEPARRNSPPKRTE